MSSRSDDGAHNLAQKLREQVNLDPCSVSFTNRAAVELPQFAKAAIGNGFGLRGKTYLFA